MLVSPSNAAPGGGGALPHAIQSGLRSASISDPYNIPAGPSRSESGVRQVTAERKTRRALGGRPYRAGKRPKAPVKRAYTGVDSLKRADGLIGAFRSVESLHVLCHEASVIQLVGRVQHFSIVKCTSAASPLQTRPHCCLYYDQYHIGASRVAGHISGEMVMVGEIWLETERQSDEIGFR